ncbi:anaerobic ribonucleoside triphosphate reductase [Butyricicoccus porcorum]|uniref:Anaerobic ribonucleoside-triphosphate reductase n=1 Tax=Butyricicoccus porcorum TaxID=1945634 RepID=A0A252F6B8_9FIRM|nr:anaerobic ribonucleoside triphosphate reductase [Butyricicoccus porcorum]MCI6927401.1 anaerobic ribonucleoside triphosphate reductase [Butyricicoccus porcorum]MDD6985802.1 anaerobic ribonucleoside triphosphate reductase [Butyricicoccus porcorum]MDY4484200.1 anaerobic ribonucleoside triphosphate reductase [Butyricicoccus porcorum]OUM21315.1 anaerobic ribonucleoside-triphosphate reductase [Butyricicoccus porcorum]
MIQQIEKRDGRCVFFDVTKIANAIYKAAEASGGHDYQMSMRLALDVADYVEAHSPTPTPSVEYVQDAVEKILVESGHAKTAKAYILYRNERSRQREMNTGLMKIYEDLTFQSAIENDIKRENANIDGDTAMGTMLKYGSEGAKQFNEMFLLEPHIAKAHREGDIHIHDFDFYTLTTTCTQIDLLKLFDGGFSTGHGFLREPNDIMSYSALACIAIQSNQNDQHGGQSVPNFDYSMAPGVRKTYWHKYRDNLAKALEAYGVEDDALETAKTLVEACEQKPVLADDNGATECIRGRLLERTDAETADKILAFTVKYARRETERTTYQAMEALVHNLNTMHSRAGAQIPFSSLNYGTDTSPEGRLVMKSLLLATEAGLGNGETSIFPIHIFKVKEGINYNPGDPNYDLFKLAIRVSAKRLFPNFSFLDAPFNAQYYKPGYPETEAAYMGCRTRVVGNNYDPSRQIVYGRGNLSFTSINLPRIAIKSNGNAEAFFQELDEKLDLVIDQLKARFQIQSEKRVRNYPFLMGQGVWIDSDKLGPDDKVGEVLKHGSLTVGFIGLAECLKALMGKHHGESEQAQRMGLAIVTRMRERMDRESRETGLNFTVIATPAEGLSGRFTRLDRERYGVIPGVTDRDYYTNSFHVPVYYPISAFRKIQLEAPYHALTNGGHISYVELDGDPTQNLDAFEAVIRYMKECGIGYGSINHPVDRDPVCGYTGIIDDVCPRCGRREGEAVSVEKLRQLGVYKNHNSDTIGYHGDPNEERDRRPNPLS